MYVKKGPQFIKCKILEKETGVYSNIVIIDLKSEDYLILTIFPNWQGVIPAKGEIGYIEFEFAQAGTTMYYDKVNSKHELFKNDYFIFKQFVKETPKCNEDVLI